jgi:hypothetical protein
MTMANEPHTGKIIYQTTGNITGRVVNEQNIPMMLVTVTATGVGATQTQLTDGPGMFKFSELQPGSYTVNAKLVGFTAPSYPGIVIIPGETIKVDITMSSAPVEIP